MRELIPALLWTLARPTFLPFALSAGLLVSAHASAQEYSARDVGDWTVAASKDKGGCFLSRTYDGTGRTMLLLGLNIDGGNHLSILNDNWSIKPRDRLKLSFRLSSGGYSNQLVVGMESEGKRGFVTNFETKFPDYFAASKALHIYRGEVPVEQLSLDGSGAAVAELRRCVGIVSAKPSAGGREKGRSAAIPKDPFAPDAGRSSED